jgi:Rps23 Pro-64 3,4-dihydroxylase Tpa1-like proline 4-hydroxylase
MTVHIKERLFSKEKSTAIRSHYSEILQESKDRPGFFESSGNLTPEVLAAVALARIEIEKQFDVIINDYEAGVVKLAKGAFNGLHSDMYNLDGTPHEDPAKTDREFSALVYLSEYGEDFTGGELDFPQHELRHQPKIGDLVFFRGDLEHTHKVRHVLSGERYAIVMFFGQ